MRDHTADRSRGTGEYLHRRLWYTTVNAFHTARYEAIRAYHARALETHDTIRDIPAITEEADRCATGK